MAVNPMTERFARFTPKLLNTRSQQSAIAWNRRGQSIWMRGRRLSCREARLGEQSGPCTGKIAQTDRLPCQVGWFGNRALGGAHQA
jgi:hypothetical protein